MDQLSQPLEDRKFEKGFMLFGSIASLLLGIGILVFFVSKVSNSYFIPKTGEKLNFTHWGAFGDFIAGVVGTFFSLAGFFLLYLTLKDQRENFHKERLESNFFEMIKFHRDNVSELEYSYYETKQRKVTTEKRKVFKVIFSQFKEAWIELNELFTNTCLNDIYMESYLKQLEKNPQLSSRKICLKEFAQVDITYLIVFFGLSKEDKLTIHNLCKNRYKEDFLYLVIDIASMKPQRDSNYWFRWDKIMTLENKYEIIKKVLNLRLNQSDGRKIQANWSEKDRENIPFAPFYPDNYNKYYGGHQFRLGHYYRNLFQTVKFIHKEKYLSEKEKYKYIKILRGQLSNYEQLVFFLNSLSEIGRTWELVKKNNPKAEIKEDNQLITKYNLIKNIPMRNIVDEINLLDYYPLVKYEAFNNGI